MRISSEEFLKDIDCYLETAKSEVIFITEQDKEDCVLLPKEEYQRLCDLQVG